MGTRPSSASIIALRCSFAEDSYAHLHEVGILENLFRIGVDILHFIVTLKLFDERGECRTVFICKWDG